VPATLLAEAGEVIEETNLLQCSWPETGANNALCTAKDRFGG
jgi:hypothetical protein